MSPDIWSLSFVYFIHLLATVVWVGGLTVTVLFVLPTAWRSLDADAYAAFINHYRRWMNSVGWICLLALLGSGMFQMSAHPNYEGFLVIHNRWAVAIFLKHLVFGVMILVNALISGWILPELYRLALRRSQGLAEDGLEKLQRREVFWMRVNGVLSVIVLALTAIARVS